MKTPAVGAFNRQGTRPTQPGIGGYFTSRHLANPARRRGMILGPTDELGFHTAENPVHVHDLQATILHLLGQDHERLTSNSKAATSA